MPKRIVIWAIAALSFFTIMEVAARIFFAAGNSSSHIILTGDERVYAYRPSENYINRHGVMVRCNSLGIIGDEIREKGAGGFRILALGDSITEGTYLNQEDNYLSILENSLSVRLRRPVQIINGAVGGYNTWQEAAFLEAIGLSLNPDMVIVGVCLNDAVKSPGHGYLRVGNRVFSLRIWDGSKARLLDFFYQRSAACKLFYDQASLLVRRFLCRDWYAGYLRNYRFELSAAEIEDWEAAFERIRLACTRNNIKSLFLIFPLANQLVRGEQHSCAPLNKYFQRHAEAYLDLIRYFTAELAKGEDIYLERDIIHPNALGHQIIAAAVSDYIVKNKLIP